MSDQLIDNYIHELRVAAWVRQMPKPRTAELEAETRARIAAQLAHAGKSDEETVYGVLGRMGPADDIVAQQAGSAVAKRQLSVVDRLQLELAVRGWGIAEIGGLLLLILGPFLLWWVGPIFGMILIRYRAERWSDRAMKRATTFVFTLFAVQAILAIAVFLHAVLTGTAFHAGQFQDVFSSVTPGGLSRALTPPIGLSPDLLAYAIRVVGALLAPVAGIGTGLYLLLSPRVRR